MKRFLFGLFSLFICVYANAVDQQTAYNLGTSVTNIVASSTNTSAGQIFTLIENPSPIRIWATANGGVAASTNGVSSVSNLVVRLVTASGSTTSTNRFDSANFTNIKLEVPINANDTNTVSSWFVVGPARYIRVSQIENNTLGIVSNIQIIVATPK